MTTSEVLTGYWHFDFTAIGISAILLGFHFLTNRRKLTRSSPLFFAGVLGLLAVTLSPINYLGRFYLFSAHMVEHVVLLLLVPPLLLAGTDPGFLNRVLQHSGVRRVISGVTKPVVAWSLGVGCMWVLHAPGLYTDIHHSAGLMGAQKILLLACGTIFIWPVVSPVEFGRLPRLASALYLFTACVGCSVLGIILSLSPDVLYASALDGNDPDLWALVRSGWGLFPSTDQQLGGLIMWVPACIIYITHIMISLTRWYRTPDQDDGA